MRVWFFIQTSTSPRHKPHSTLQGDMGFPIGLREIANPQSKASGLQIRWNEGVCFQKYPYNSAFFMKILPI